MVRRAGMGGRRMGLAVWMGVVGGLLLLAAPAPAVATCSTFAAWLRPDNVRPTHPNCTGVPCDNNVTAFLTLDVAPDAMSVVVRLQVTAVAGATQRAFLGAGVFGGAKADQIKPSGSGAMLSLGVPHMTPGKTSTMSVRIVPDDMTALLGFLAEDRAYAAIWTSENTDGELRGQLGAPECYESRVVGTDWTNSGGNKVNPYAFANVLFNKMEPSYAVLLQLATDDSRLFPGEPLQAQVNDVAGASLLPGGGVSTASDAYYYRRQRADDLSLFDTVWLQYGAVNRGDAEEKVYAVGQLAGMGVVNGLKAKGANVVIISNSPDNYMMMANMSMALPCRQLISAQDSLFTMARARQSDWLTVWSLNEGQPDSRMTLEPRYYAHPFVVQTGETGQGIMERFGMSEKEMYNNNPAVGDIGALSMGTVLCVVPNWLNTIGGNGQKICTATN